MSHAHDRYRALPAAQFRRQTGRSRRVRGAQRAHRPHRCGRRPRRQSARGAVQGGRAGKGRAGRQRDGLAASGLRRALDTDERGLLGTLQPAAQPPASAGQSVVAAGAGAAGRAQGRRRRPVQAAGAPAARRRRRAVHFRRHRLRAVSRHRLHQCGLPPHHAARAAAGRRRPDRAERHARHLSRSRREEGAGAGRLCGRLASGGFSRRHDGAAQCRRARHHRRPARPAGAGGEMRHQRHLCAGRRRICDRGRARSGRPRRAGRAVRRICRLLRRGEAQSGSAHHRDHAPRGCAVPDLDHRRPRAGAHRHRAALRDENRNRRPGRR